MGKEFFEASQAAWRGAIHSNSREKCRCRCVIGYVKFSGWISELVFFFSAHSRLNICEFFLLIIYSRPSLQSLSMTTRITKAVGEGAFVEFSISSNSPETRSTRRTAYFLLLLSCNRDQFLGEINEEIKYFQRSKAKSFIICVKDNQQN